MYVYVTSCDVTAPPQSSNILFPLVDGEVLVAKTSEEGSTADGGRTTPYESNLQTIGIKVKKRRRRRRRRRRKVDEKLAAEWKG